jgi:chromosome partitioning protein
VTLELARGADLIVQPTGPSLDDLHPAVLVFHALAGSGIPHERMVFALSRTSAKEEEDAAREYLEAAGYEVLRGAIPERVGYRQALNRGKALTETEEKTLNERADDLLEALLEKVAARLDGSKATMEKKRKAEGAA